MLILEHHALICGINVEELPQGCFCFHICFAPTNICFDIAINIHWSGESGSGQARADNAARKAPLARCALLSSFCDLVDLFCLSVCV